ncbi:hypothetical protein Back11_56830 [Paenibacillus baekrokdamisoli]|uniref:Uncharacterized protein n=1 Tax=Paenibacillus baekrokdamisoli TaxID=1712516 RepID=A0A3G9JJR1_9BACL|nr:hypothetical protein Back11_56830 [Paenibacillus baekrokdamisoli]
MISQVSEVPAELDILFTIENSNMKRPTEDRYLIVDTASPFDSYMDEVMSYMNDDD